MRFGIGTPIVVTPKVASPWEKSAGIAEIAEIAKTADRLGYEFMTCSDHVAVPTSAETGRGLTFWDPAVLFGYLAAITQKIRFASYVVVLGYHHPLAIAKRYGQVDAMSGGRLILGVGVGNLKEEFDLLNAPFEDRGVRADEAILALRAALSQRQPKFEGKYYSFSDFVVLPHAVQAKVPIWVGGTSKRSLRRAVELADAWSPVFLSNDQVAAMLSTVELPPGFDIVLQTGFIDPLKDPDGARKAIDGLQALGATQIGLKVAHTSLRHYLDQIEAFHDLMGMKG